MAQILVIDDSATAIQKAKTALGRAGHQVETLEMMIHLGRAIRQNPPDLVLLDLRMPALSGVAFGRLIRRFQDRPIPIVVYSSQPEDEMVLAANEVGAFDCVRKADSDEILAETVNRALADAAGRGA